MATDKKATATRRRREKKNIEIVYWGPIAIVVGPQFKFFHILTVLFLLSRSGIPSTVPNPEASGRRLHGLRRTDRT